MFWTLAVKHSIQKELDELHPKTPYERIYSYYISSIFNIICSHQASQMILVLNIIKMLGSILFLIGEIMYILVNLIIQFHRVYIKIHLKLMM